jgi:pimeloyl-ACP methyl ester carboxylesterase
MSFSAAIKRTGYMTTGDHANVPTGVTCSGGGAPTVVLETGLGAESREWAEVYQGVESLTRVCRYDRAAMQERREELQQRLLKLSSRATYSVVRSSGHFIQRDDPRAVLAVILTAIAEARCAPGVPAVGGG